jgi:hypothetical protein
MNKKVFFIAIVAILALAIGAGQVFAKNDKNADDEWVAPEQDGTYDVPGHPGLKVRVFVHREKPAKPGPVSNLQCGLSDPDSSAPVAGAGWIIPDGTWKYRINPSAPSTISPNLDAIVSNSFAAWMNTTDLKNSGVNLQSGGTTSTNRAVYDGQNIIAWGRASASALGVTYIWYQGGVAKELDTIMNNKFTWNWSGGSTACAYANVYDAQNILTHELGHWFGLDDHYTCDYADNTMYGYGSKGEVKKDTLTKGDISGINAIY